MTKKVWSVILLCVLTALLVVLCTVTVKTQILWSHHHFSDDTSSGVSFFAGVWTALLASMGTVIAIFLSAVTGIFLSLLNIRIAPNQIIKSVSTVFLYLFLIPAFAFAIVVLVSLVQTFIFF